MRCSQSRIEEIREQFRYLNKTNSTGMRDVASKWWIELVNLYGTKVSYYRHGYNTATQDDYVYGEDPTASFHRPRQMNALVQWQQDALLLSKFGLQTEADLMALITVEDFQNTFGIGTEPKSGDVIQLDETAWEFIELPPFVSNCNQGIGNWPIRDPSIPDPCDFPVGPFPSTTVSGADMRDLLCTYKNPSAVAQIWLDMNQAALSALYGQTYVRCPQMFEITEKRYQDFTQPGANFLMGHYVWILHGKRFDYSFEPGITPECGLPQVYDDTFSGRLTGGTNPATDPKEYDQNVRDESDEDIWDYGAGDETRNTDVYGDY